MTLSSEQKQFFDINGYLVLENILDETQIINPVKAEYETLLDGLVAGWVADGSMPALPEGADFLTSYRLAILPDVTGSSHWIFPCRG